MSSPYKYPIDQCDVTGPKAVRSLQRYRDARQKWLKWLDDDEHHAVWKQIDGMMWNDAVYRSVNEAKRFSKEGARTAASNGMLMDLVDRGYVATQVLAIWKLMDQHPDVISLRRLFDSIFGCKHLLTRENYVTFDGLPYDPEAAKNAFYSRSSENEITRLRGLPTDGPQSFGRSEVAHIAFDRLSGVAPEKRSRTDTVSLQVFNTIEGWFNDPVFDSLIKLRHNFVAHAADEKARAVAALPHVGISPAGQSASLGAHQILDRPPPP